MKLPSRFKNDMYQDPCLRTLSNEILFKYYRTERILKLAISDEDYQSLLSRFKSQPEEPIDLNIPTSLDDLANYERLEGVIRIIPTGPVKNYSGRLIELLLRNNREAQNSDLMNSLIEIDFEPIL